MTATGTEHPRIAFYAPMKSPDHATPSGDRRIARLTLDALRLAGFDPVVASDFRSLDMKGDAETQKTLMQTARQERERLVQAYDAAPPKLWFTYHCYYKAPDLLGPELAETFGIPYVISEPSISPSRREGAWSSFAQASEAAIASADRLFWTTERDRPALEDAGHAKKMNHLKAFVETGKSTTVDRHSPRHPLRLLTIAMMRPGDKVESYRRLAAALPHVQSDWQLTIIGDGSERGQVEALFQAHSDRIRFVGQIDSATQMDQALSDADLFVWPGVGEGVGMVYLEAQASGLPVIAENHPAPSELIAGRCVEPNDAKAFAQQIDAMSNLKAYRIAAQQAQNHVARNHSLSAAADVLRDKLAAVLQ